MSEEVLDIVFVSIDWESRIDIFRPSSEPSDDIFHNQSRCHISKGAGCNLGVVPKAAYDKYLALAEIGWWIYDEFFERYVWRPSICVLQTADISYFSSPGGCKSQILALV
jgi:hypothetical protein